MADQNDLLLEVKNLKTHFFLAEGVVRAVDGISFDIRRGQTLGIIGESGCGKSVTGQSILRIVPSPPGQIVGGEILFHRQTVDGWTIDHIDLAKLDPRGDEIRKIRGDSNPADNLTKPKMVKDMNENNKLDTIGARLIRREPKKEKWADLRDDDDNDLGPWTKQ